MSGASPPDVVRRPTRTRADASVSGGPLLSVERLTKLFPVPGAGTGRWIGGAGTVRAIGDAGTVRAIGGAGTVRAIGGAGMVRAIGGAGMVRAVDGVSFALDAGETLALVGESGCGKSTTGRMLLRLTEPTSGTVRFDGEDLMRLGRRALRRRRRDLQIVFQDPYSSLSPRQVVEDIVAEPLDVHGLYRNRTARRDRVVELLQLVGLDASHLRRRPFEFSGGQRQRIAIARALAPQPRLIVADEPVSALDVSIQSQVVNLMQDLQARFGVAYVFISHDLAVVRHIAHRVAVMYLGRLVEIGETDALFDAPHHPYTQALLSAAPIADPERRRSRIVLSGDVPSPAAVPSGCYFHPRCPVAQAVCTREAPPLRSVGAAQAAACHFARPFPIPVG